jgi:hypothetical protein
MVVGLEAMEGVIGLGSAAWTSDPVIPHPAALLLEESICCCCRNSSVEGEPVQSLGEMCYSSCSTMALTLPAVYIAKVPSFLICCADGRISRCSKMNLQAGEHRDLLIIRLKDSLQCVQAISLLLSSQMPCFSIFNHGWAAHGHGTDMHISGFEHLVADEIESTHEGEIQYLCCPLLSFFLSDCCCKLCTSLIMPVCWRWWCTAGCYIQILAGGDKGLLICFLFVSTLMLLQIFCRWRPHALRPVSWMLSMITPGRRTPHPLQAGVQADYAIFLSLGLIRRGRVRASPMSFPRFSEEDPFVLSSVLRHLDLQLNHQPQMHQPTRLPVEPLALRLVRLPEALEECNCRFLASEFSPDTLAGSSCILPLRQFGFPAVCLLCVRLGTSRVNSVYQSMSLCMSWIVILTES